MIFLSHREQFRMGCSRISVIIFSYEFFFYSQICLDYYYFFAVHKIIHTDIKNSFHMSCYISQWHGRD
jgi:hypothetical protein